VYTGPGEPPRVRPPLTKRLTRRHWILLDRLAAVPAVIIMVALVWAGRHSAAGAPNGAWLLPALLLAAMAGFPIALRRVHPLASLGTLLAMSVTLSALGGQDGLIVALPMAYVLYMAAVLCSRRTAAIALVCTLGAVLGEAFLIWNGGIGSGIVLDLILIIFWGLGSAVRQRRLYAGGLQQQAASRAVAEERLRIARELHDVVAHSMSVIAVQAGFGQYVIDEQPGKAREALGAIQATSRDALDEMRRMLSVLRQADTTDPADDGTAATDPRAGSPERLAGRLTLADLTADAPRRPSGTGDAPGVTADGRTAAGVERPSRAPLRPAPGLGDLDRLITRIGHAGVHVDLRVHGERGNVPAGIDLSAFRIVQEALTNVVKHAATPDCRVTIDYREDELSLEVVDDGGAAVLAPAGPGSGDIPSGHGLIGMRERVHLCGGQFSAGPRPERGFRVAATLPLDRGTV
jgi:signal transduction histidine kinase